MDLLKTEQELRKLVHEMELFDDLEAVLPERLEQKLKRVPTLSELEAMFEEYSSEDILNSIPDSATLERHCNASYNNIVAAKEAYYKNTIYHNSMPAVRDPVEEISDSPPRPATPKDLSKNMNPLIDLTVDTDDDDDDDDIEEGSTADPKSDSSDALPYVTKENYSDIMIQQILERALPSINEINKERYASLSQSNTIDITENATDDQDVVIVETPPEPQTMGAGKVEPLEIVISGDNSDDNLSVNKYSSSRTQHTLKQDRGKKSYIFPKRSANADTIMKYKLKYERYKYEEFDIFTRNILRNSQRNAISKPDNSTRVWNISYFNKNCQSKKKSTIIKTSIRVIPTLNSRITSKAKSTSKNKKFANCPVCLEKLNSTNIRSAQCGHVFCARCMKYLFLKGDKKCPTCKSLLKGSGHYKLFM